MTADEAEILAKLLKSLCIIRKGQVLNISGHSIKIK